MSLLCLFLQGVLYDLFECLYSYMDNANLTSIPIYFISPVADSSLAYANIFAEWYDAKSSLRLNSRFSMWSNQIFFFWFLCSLSVNVRATRFVCFSSLFGSAPKVMLHGTIRNHNF